MAKTDVKSMTLEELQLFMGELGEPKFRAKQIFDWLHQKQVDTFAEMTNLSQKLRERLEQAAWKWWNGSFPKKMAPENTCLPWKMAPSSKVF